MRLALKLVSACSRHAARVYLIDAVDRIDHRVDILSTTYPVTPVLMISGIEPRLNATTGQRMQPLQ